MATQSYATTGMQSINTVQQRIPLQVTTGQQAQTSGQKTVTLSNQQQATIIQPAQAHSGQPFIVTISADGNSENMQEVQIQQGTPSQVIYQAGHSSSQQSYSEYNQVYNPVSANFYHTAGSGQMTQLGGLQSQVLQGGTYLVQSTMDGDGQHITHTTRASPATVQWLIDNYETAEGVSLPRSTLYNHYLRHCQEQKIDPMNPASFGKLIRSVFLGLRTRRLGTRGNSKYHYYGIRIKPTSPLNAFTDDHALPMRQQPLNPGKRFKPAGGAGAEGGDSGAGGGASVSSGENSQQHQHQQFLGDASSAIPVFGHVEVKASGLPEGITLEHVRYFEELFKKQCEQILSIVVNLHFSEVEKIWQAFWRTTPVDQKQNAETIAEHKLPKEKLYALSSLQVVKDFVRRSDYAFYQALVEVLIPDVLRPIPSSLTQAVRNFAKSLEGWLKNAMTGVPEDMVKTKIASVSAFAQTLRRYTSLNHLAQAARAVLQNNTQISQMLTDLNRVDFTNVQEQASWVCECEDGLVHQIQEDFKNTLQGQNSLETWALWLEGVVNRVLSPHEGGPHFAKAARQFLLKWSFYSSMVIRDLTLRSAASFGSFHLIRLLYDEYMFYLVEHKVAAATDESPIAVMGEVRHQSLESHISSTTGDIDSKVQLTGRTQGSVVSVASNSHSVLTAQQLVATVSGASSAAQHLPVSNTTGLGQVTSLGAHGTPTHPTPVAVVASGAGGGGTKTIVVVPVSATSGSGDAPTIKRIKTTT